MPDAKPRKPRRKPEPPAVLGAEQDELRVEWVPVDSIHLDPANVRKHPERNLESIKASLARFGQRTAIVVDGDGIVRKGNGTLMAARALGWPRIAIHRTHLKGAEAIAYAIADNRTAELAVWDETGLAEQLRGLQSEDFDLGAVGFLDTEVDELVNRLADELANSGGGGGLAENYSRKIEAPIYEPKGTNPPVSALYDNAKTVELVREIEAANLPREVSDFLKLAAERHTVFHFRNIAEFYAHADEKTQDLMERSALVIIDFDKAIANGYVRMTERIGALADTEGEDEGDDGDE